VTRRVQDAEADLAETDLATLRQLYGGDRRRDLERSKERLWVLEAVAVEGMNGDLGARMPGYRRVVADVIPVAVGRDDELQGPVAGGKLIDDPRQRRGRGVDRDRFTRARIRQDVDVRRCGPDDPVEALYVRPRAWL
jgi:hypothetical protein